MQAGNFTRVRAGPHALPSVTRPPIGVSGRTARAVRSLRADGGTAAPPAATRRPRAFAGRSMLAAPFDSKTLPQRPTNSASTLLEYVLAVSLLGLAMVGGMRFFIRDAKTVADNFQAATGSGELPCDPTDPFC